MTVIGFPAPGSKYITDKGMEDWPWDQDLGKPYLGINGELDPDFAKTPFCKEQLAKIETEALLTERSKTHGDYNVKATIIQDIKTVMRGTTNWHVALNDEQRESLEMIAHKIGRILSGDPNVKDHWEDIAGYATLPIRGERD